MNQRRGSGRQAQQHTPVEQQSGNQRLSLAERGNMILSQIVQQRSTLEAFLPTDITFERFHSTVFMLLRHKPDILDCTPASIIQCCLRAAYDGVNLDNIEAAAIPSNNNYKDPENSSRWIKKREARYNIMVAGVRKQIMATGLFRGVDTVLIYENEEFRIWTENDKRHVVHEQKIVGRGKLAGAYSMATYLDGGVSYELMAEDDINDLKEFATQKGQVWDGKMQGEMWRKSVLRRHKKTLLGGKARPDAEEIEMFPDNPANAAALPAPRARPQRSDYHVADQSGTEGGVDIGFGFADRQMAQAFDQMEEMSQGGGQVEEKTTKQAKPAQQERKPAQNSDSQVEENDRDAGGEVQPELTRMPATPEDWTNWQAWVAAQISAALNVNAVNQFWRSQQHIISAAHADVANKVNDAFSDAIADLMTEPPSDDAGASQGGDDTPAGGN